MILIFSYNHRGELTTHPVHGLMRPIKDNIIKGAFLFLLISNGVFSYETKR